MNRNEHPAWQVYDALRTSFLAVKYYTHKLDKVKKNEHVIDIFLAITIPSSAVAILPVWNNDIGKPIWAILVIIAAFISVARPFLNLGSSIQMYEGAIARHAYIYAELDEIKSLIEHKQNYSPELKEKYLHIVHAKRRAIEMNPKEPEDKELSEVLFKQINESMPPDSFYIPEN